LVVGFAVWSDVSTDCQGDRHPQIRNPIIRRA
jgi:hypothetical protein